MSDLSAPLLWGTDTVAGQWSGHLAAPGGTHPSSTDSLHTLAYLNMSVSPLLDIHHDDNDCFRLAPFCVLSTREIDNSGDSSLPSLSPPTSL